MKSEINGKVVQFEIKRRTFEGKADSSKNDQALTSKYMPSQKYIAFYTVQSEDNTYSYNKCYTTKKEAEEDMQRMSHGFRIW